MIEEAKGSALASWLWADNADLAYAVLKHPFVRGLADNSLPRQQFQFYVGQDAFFLEAFARAYGFGLGRSPDRYGLEAFHELIGGVLEELKLHASYAARWHVNLDHVEPSPATLAYTDFLLNAASTGSLGEICAAMTPCMRLYAYLGQSLESEGAARPDNQYRDWIETYASPDFDALAATLEGLLNRYANSDSQATREAYRHAMQLELVFFSAATDAIDY